MVTVGASNTRYEFTWAWSNTALGASCTGGSTIQMVLTWQEPAEAAAVATNLTNLNSIRNGTNNGVLGPIPTHANWIGNSNSFHIFAKAGTVVSYTGSYVAATGCSPSPAVTIYPTLIQVN